MGRRLLYAALSAPPVTLAAGSDAEVHPPPDFNWLLALVIGLFGGAMLLMAVWSFATKYRQFYGVSQGDVYVPVPALPLAPPPAPVERDLRPSLEPVAGPEPGQGREPPELGSVPEPIAAAPEDPMEEISGWKFLGQGQYTMVSRCTLDGRDVAVKSFLDTSEGHLALLQQELAALVRLAHPRLVLVVEAIADPLMVVMEYCGQGTFQQYLRRTPPSLAVAVQMALGAVEGIRYLAEQGVMHGFLSAHNCFVVQDEGPVPSLKVSDYGLSREYARQAVRPRVFEWSRWQPPELLLEDVQGGPASDVYSCGVLLWEALTFGALPYGDLNAAQARQAILAGCLLPVPARCPLPLQTLLQWCWRHDPLERPAPPALLEHLSAAHQSLVLASPGLPQPALAAPYSSPRVLPVDPTDAPLSIPGAGASASSGRGVRRRTCSTVAPWGPPEVRPQELWRNKTPPPFAFGARHFITGSGSPSLSPLQPLDPIAAGIAIVRQPPPIAPITVSPHDI